MKLGYKHTKYACYLSYIAGAIINNFAPLLFVAFSKDFSLSVGQLSYIIVLNFATQLVVDFLGAQYVDKIGYRKTLIIALFFAGTGLVMLGTLPFILPAYIGILLSVLTYATGSGLLEVMVSPTIEALPNDKENKNSMALLHSFYCWGSVLVIVASTLYFSIAEVENWRYLCFLWAIIPYLNIVLFTKVPIIPFGNGHEKIPIIKMLTSKLFILLIISMFCSGAAEIAMSQWASLFAEIGLNVSKTTGDLLGPCFFAILMGTSRVLFSKFSEKKNIISMLFGGSIVTILGYLTASLSPNPIISLLGCGICGFGVGGMWPGVLSLAAKHYTEGGTAMFALLAMGGDIGCTMGPYSVALISEKFSIMGSELSAGMLFAIIFPLILIVALYWLKRIIKKQEI